jgi:hypothetical protein
MTTGQAAIGLSAVILLSVVTVRGQSPAPTPILQTAAQRQTFVADLAATRTKLVATHEASVAGVALRSCRRSTWPSGRERGGLS